MSQNSVDLTRLFQTVAQSLQENQRSLNQADSYNQDHGSNMVQTFQTIASALEEKKTGSDSAALAYAAQKLSQQATSGSGRLYAQNLTRAAGQFKGKDVDEQGALQLLQTLIGAGQAGQGASGQPGGADMLGSLLGDLAESGADAQQTPSAGSSDLLGTLLGGLADGGATNQQVPAGGTDLLGALLGGLAGGETSPASAQQGSGFDLQDLLAAGMAFLQARQQGQGNLQALVQAFVAGSGMGGSTHRDQSTQLVVQSFLQALNGLSAR